ncbi:MAG: pyruvate dehydrogenase (acetyl-transferring) E1 component subunit alpha [Rhodospirillaceae bacterium]|nr:pyruvate dehydrogenase (acetyl-transferring) E1 component subunit alpha [Rhodospirillaceae bacterium]
MSNTLERTAGAARTAAEPGPGEAPAGRIVARFAVAWRRYLDTSGAAVAPLPAWTEDRALMLSLYRGMVLTRVFDQKAVSLQRTGQLGTFASSLGQEATVIGLASAMRPEDVLLPTYREHGAQIWRGVSMTELLQYWGGDERGSAWANPAVAQDFPISVPVASHALHAVGVATAMKLRRQARAALCVLGDGATSKGDFYEAVNLAGVWKLPVVFVVSNNQWAISVPRSRQSAAQTLAQKAIAGGFDGEQVDGNDVVAVREAVAGALERARAGEGPGLVEALTYRMSDHSTADDARRYRRDEEVSARWAEDPVARLRAFLVGRQWWGKADEERLLAACQEEVEAAKAAYLATAPEPPTAMFDHLYATLPPALRRQRDAIAGGGNG